MQQNEFEKQVQKMMDEFTPHPSEAVWQNISSRINTGKRKKRRFAFWLFTLLLIAAGGTLLYNFSGNKNEALSVDKEKIALHDTAAQTAAPVKQGVAPQPMQAPPEQAAADRPHEENIKSGMPTYEAPGLQPRPFHQRHDINTQSRPGIPAQSPVLAAAPAAGQENTPVEKTADEPTITVNQNNFTDTVAISKVQETNSNIAITDTVAGNLQQSPAMDAMAKMKQQYVLSRWQWGVTAAYGASNVVSGIISSNKAAQDYTFLPGNTAGDTSNMDGVKNPYASSGAYHIGIVAQKRVMKNAFIASGLSFVHLSTISAAGKKVDTTLQLQAGNGRDNSFSVAGYYQPGDVSEHTNTYNFIELPLYFQQDIQPQNKFSFSYNAGFSIRQLISSDALIYDPYSNIYYSKNALLNKTQVQFAAGLSLKINTGKNNALYIGPQFSYSISGLYKNGSAGSAHFINYGLQAAFLMHKK